MIKLFSDMGADIPVEIAQKYKIHIFNMSVTDGENEYILNKDIDKYKLFDNMAKGVNYKTSQVSYKDFYDAFKEELLANNEIIYISLSSGLSGTFNTANMVKNDLLEEFPDSKIHIVDSLGASFGYGVLAVKVAQMIDNNKTVEDILKYTEFFKKHINYIFTLDKVRGNKAFKKKFLDIIKSRSSVLDKQTILILHGDCEEKANEIKELLNTEFNNDNIIISGVDAVIGCHTGPTVLAIVYLDELYGKYDIFEI